MALFQRRKGKNDPVTREMDDEVTSAAGADREADVVSDSGSGVPDSINDTESQNNTEALNEAERAARRQRSKLRPRDDIDRSNGPFDSSEVDASERLDFGSLWLRPTEDVEMRLDVEESSQIITGLTVMLADAQAAAVQLQAFAAPKTSGVWYGIRREIAEAILSSGGTAEEVDGALGTELHVRMSSVGPDGRTTYSPARFVGVDGPRWFLRAVLSGQAAVDEDVAERAMAFVRSVAVHRGSDARAPRELLELAIPQELIQQQAPSAEDDARARIERMERGPEITEIN